MKYNYYYEEEPSENARIIIEEEPEATKLFDQYGRRLYRRKEPIGFRLNDKTSY